MTSNNYPAPSSKAYDAFNSYTDDGGFSTKRELAMFLAEILWESGGLKYKSEIHPPAGAYVDASLVASLPLFVPLADLKTTCMFRKLDTLGKVPHEEL